MGVLDFGDDCRRGSGNFGVKLGCPIVINGVFATRCPQITLRTCSEL